MKRTTVFRTALILLSLWLCLSALTACGKKPAAHTHTPCETCGLCTAADCIGATAERCMGHAPHAHTACPICNLCTSPACPGAVTAKCLGHEPHHLHTACTDCGLCIDPACTGEADAKCAGHEGHIHTLCAACGLCLAEDCADKLCPGHPAEAPLATYIALGDSIARGYAIDLKTVTYDESGARLVTIHDAYYRDDGTPTFAKGSYTALLKEELFRQNAITAAYNYARSGDTCGDLLAFLKGVYDPATKSVKEPDALNARYASMTNREVYDSLVAAKTVTVCIGANNVLGPALEKLMPYMAGQINEVELERSLRVALAGEGTAGESGYRPALADEYAELLSLLYTLCPDADILFTTVYNPYRKMEVGEGILAMEGMGLVTNAAAKLQTVEKLAELFIAGGKDSLGRPVKGINTILAEAVGDFCTDQIRRIYVADAKDLFDSVTIGEGVNYSDLVNTEMGQMTVADTMRYHLFADPHPTGMGHLLLFREHKAILDSMNVTP